MKDFLTPALCSDVVGEIDSHLLDSYRRSHKSLFVEVLDDLEIDFIRFEDYRGILRDTGTT